MQILPIVGQHQRLLIAFFWNCFIVPQWLLNGGKQQEQLRQGERKRKDGIQLWRLVHERMAPWQLKHAMGWWLYLAEYFIGVLVSQWLCNEGTEWCFQWCILACKRHWWTSCLITYLKVHMQFPDFFIFFFFQRGGERRVEWGWSEF